MTSTPTKRRAPGMSPEDRREMIVRAALPLVVEHGVAITTSQVARAAGIGEGTIFRAFTDKDELLDACLTEAFRTDHIVEALAEIPLDLPLGDRLVEAAETLTSHMDRMGALMAAMHAAGRHRRRARQENTRRDEAPREDTPSGDTPNSGNADGNAEPSRRSRKEARRDQRTQSFEVTRAALAELLAPESDTLRLPADRLASLFLALLTSRARQSPDEEPVPIKDIVEVFLHGAMGSGAANPGAAG